MRHPASRSDFGFAKRFVATDTIAPDISPCNRWTLEVTLDPEAGGCPPALLRAVAARELTIRDVSPQGPYWRVVAVA
jgi:hypothetical protein